VLSLGAAAALGNVLAACGRDHLARVLDAGDGPDGGADAGATASDAEATPLVDGATAGDAAASVAWASGGTAAMKDRDRYPNPFSSLPTACAVTCELTQGPCYSSQSVERQDISYGYEGLPLRLCLRILDESCQPVSGAVVDVWHVGPTGKYSGDDPANEDVAYCTGNDADFTSHLYFRGKQTADADGIVAFDTCFPGWYSGRTIHIHMTIRIGDDAYLTTQFGFDDTLDDEIVTTQPIYKDRGQRDTTNTSDGILSATGVTGYLFETAKMSDGAMLAWKTVILRSSLSESLCSPGGGGGAPGGQGPGGIPGDGGAPPGRDAG
jgi:protocatechuate 3,4-dioxygenase beta subunit